MWTFQLQLPDDVQVGDEYDIWIQYEDKDLFTNRADDAAGKAMQDYVFNGGGLVDGFIKIEEETTTTSTTPTTTTEAKTTTYAKTTTTAPKTSLPYIVPSTINMTPGDTAELIVLNKPENAELKWTSDNTGVATVKDGIVTALTTGEATIYAICNNQTMSCEIKVYNNSYESSTQPVSTITATTTTIATSKTTSIVTLPQTTTTTNADDIILHIGETKAVSGIELSSTDNFKGISKNPFWEEKSDRCGSCKKSSRRRAVALRGRLTQQMPCIADFSWKGFLEMPLR